MIIRKAEPKEYAAVCGFYDTLIEEMAVLPYHPKWQKGIYPEYEYLKAAIRAGELFVAIEDEVILGAMVVNHSVNDGYRDANWHVSAEAHQVTLIHTLGVAVHHMHRGIGKAMVSFAIRQARESGQKAIRLDVIDGNLPARKLYEGLGFRFIQHQTMYYEDTGWCGFDLFELSIDH